MTGTYTAKGEAHDGVQGGYIEFGSISVDPASVAANAQGIETTAITGTKVGDLVFVNMEAGPTSFVCTGGKITVDGTLSLYFNNTIDSSTAVNASAVTVDVMIVHLS